MILSEEKTTKHYECITIEKISFIDAYDPKQKHIWHVKDSIYIDLINNSSLFRILTFKCRESFYNEYSDYFTMNIQINSQWILRLFYNEYSD